MIICHCANINNKTIIKSINEGNDSLEKLKKSLRVCVFCKCCKESIEEILEETQVQTKEKNE